MFKSNKGIDSNHLNNSTLPKINDSYNDVPKITSTPLNTRNVPLSRKSSVLLSPMRMKLTTPRRYSLSDMNSSANKASPQLQKTHSPGPLLASLSYKDNISLYEETRSSGLARRIVTYNEESEQEKKPTHQEKYDSPGLFPIVHLFKKKQPPLHQLPKRVKIKLASPDYLRSISPLQKNKILEGLSRTPNQNQNMKLCSQNVNETSTKSVLDALKEISRKRIHSNEECDSLEEPGKRIRIEQYNGITHSSKRARPESPQLDTADSPTTKQSQKKFCVYDEFAASKSSTDFSFLSKMDSSRSKRKTISTSTDSLKDIKQVKLINAETQTITTNNDCETKLIGDDSESNIIKSKKKESPLKVFDDAPLDRIRKNRLAALMGNLAGKNAAILPKISTEEKSADVPPKFTDTVDNIKEPEKSEIPKTDSVNRPLTSILSPPKTKELPTIKSDKHVHFTLPSTAVSPILVNFSSTQSSTSIVTPIVSASVSTSSEKTKLIIPTPIPSSTIQKSFANDNVKPNNSEEQSVIPVSTTTISPVNVLNSNQNSIPKIDFGSPKTAIQPKSGGFKFDLKVTSASNASSIALSPTPISTFSNSTILSNTNSSNSTTSLTSSSSTTFTFGKSNESEKESTFNPAVTTSNITTSVPTLILSGSPIKAQTEVKSPSFNFNVVENSSIKFPQFPNNTPNKVEPSTTSLCSKDISASFNFTQSTPTITTSSLFNFGGAKTITSSTSNSNNKLSFSFGTKNTVAVTSTSLFGHTNSGVSNFGDNSKLSTSAFSAPSTTSSTSTTTSEFGNTLVNSSPMFGNTPGSTMPVFSSTSGNTSVISNQPTPLFGGTPVTSAPAFGNSIVTTVPVFGPTSMPSIPTFGSNPMTVATFGSTSSPPLFSSSATTTNSMFGNANFTPTTVFENTTTTKPPVFGNVNSTFGTNPTTTSTSAPVFGSTSVTAPTFGSNNVFGTTNSQTSNFGNNTVNAFGNSSETKPLFGSSSTTSAPTFGNSAFGTTTSVTTTPASVFGLSNSTPTFSFGSNKPTTNVFGSAATTISSSTFGSNTFTANNAGFGNNTPAFGNSAQPSFGVTSTSTFGQAENKAAFTFGASNENKPNSVFTAVPANPAFEKGNQNTFGNSSLAVASNTPGFNPQATNGGFNFGSAAATPPAFKFGSNSSGPDVSKPTFNFTGGSNPPAFGSSAITPSFGAAAPIFGATGSPSAGIFNIGAGTTTGRPRTQLRAKRRT